MTTLQEIERAVSKLNDEELARFRQWFEEFDASLWDVKFDQDAQSGKLDKLASEALAEFRKGKTKEL